MMQVGPDARGHASLLGCNVFGVRRPAEATVVGVLVAHASRRMVEQHFPPTLRQVPPEGSSRRGALSPASQINNRTREHGSRNGWS